MNIGNLIAKIGVDNSGLDKGLGDATKKFKAFGKNTKALGRNLTAGITAPLAGIAASSFKTASDFEAGMAKVLAVSGATKSEFKALEAEALRLGSSTSYTAGDVAGLQLEFAKLGFTSTEINKVTGATLNLAKASGSDLARSAEVAGATLRGFGLDASETERVTDVMASSFSSTALDMESFAESMKYVAPVAKAAGVDIETVTGMLGTMANAGIKGSQAGTSLRRIISELGSEGGSVTEKIKNLAAEGLTMGGAMDEVGRNAQSALLVLSEGTSQTDALAETFRNSAGATAEMAAIMESTSTGGIAKMQSAIEGAQIVIGKALAPTIMKLVKFIENLANKFTNLSSETQATIITIAGIVAAIGPMLLILPQLVSVAGVVGPALGAAFTAMTGPIGLTIAAIAGLVTAFFYFYDDVKGPLMKVINFFIDLYNENTGLRIAIAILKTTFVNSFTMMKRAVLTVFDSFSLLVEVISVAFTDGFEAAYDTAMSGMDKIAGDVVATGEEMAQNFTDAVNDAARREPIELVTEADMDAARDRVMSLIPDLSLGGGGGGGLGNLAAEDSGSGGLQTMSTLGGGGAGQGNMGGLAMMGTTIADNLELEQPRIQSFMNSFKDELSNSTGFVDEMAMAAQGLGQSFGDAFSMILQGSEEGKEALKDVASQTIDTAFNAATASAIQAATASASSLGPLGLALLPAAIAGGVALVRGAFNAITGLADGGVVFGETLVNVGEYGGVRSNPEVIAPLDKLQSMIAGSGGGTVQVQGVLRGKDIFLSQQRTALDMASIKGY